MDVLAQLLTLLVLTRALGEAAERLGQPAAVGELAAGILLAAVVMLVGERISFIGTLATSEVLEWVANLGIFFLVLNAGVELSPSEIVRHSKGAFVVALGGMLLPLVSGFALAWVFLPESDLKHAQALLVGVALSVSAIPATVKVLGDLGLLHSRVGETVVSAAIFDDVLGLMLLAVLTAVIQTGEIPDLATLALLFVKVAGFFAATMILGVHVYPRVSRKLKMMQAVAVELSALVIIALAYGLLAELLGMHWVLGAFMAGLFFEPARVGKGVHVEIRLVTTAITAGFLGPLFFASIGVKVDLSVVTGVPLFLLLLIVLAFSGKMLGAGLPALWSGLGRHEALAVGIGMSARGAVELVIIRIAWDAGLFAGVPGWPEGTRQP